MTPAGARSPPLRTRLLGPALILAVSFGWGLNWPVMKFGLLEIPLWTFRAASSLAAGLCLLAVTRLVSGSTLPPVDEWPGLALAALFNVTLWQVLVAYGLRLVAAGQTAILAFTMPLWAVMLGRVFLGEPLGWRAAMALGLGMAGIAALLARDFAAIAAAPGGVAIVLAGAIAWAIGTLIQKRQRSSLSAMAMAGWQLTLGSLPMLVMIPPLEGFHVPAFSGTAWLALAYTTFISLVSCWYAWFKVVRLLPMSVASIGILLSPVVGVVSGATLLGEPIGASEVLALALIGSALALILVAAPPDEPIAAA